MESIMPVINNYGKRPCFTAFFPHHLISTQRRVEEEVGKEQSTHLGRWVP